MATIGTITVAFGADLRGLSEGIDSVVDMFGQVSRGVERLADQLDSLSRRDVKINVSADSSGVEDATRGIQGLSAAIEDTASTEPITRGLSEVSAAAQATAAQARAATTFFGRFGEVASASLRLSADDAVRGSESFAEMRDSVSGMRGSAQQSLDAVAAATESTSSAARGCSDAFSALASGDSPGRFADAAIIAAGRTVAAYGQLRAVYSESLPAALQATGTAIATLSSTLGGADTVMAAYRGSAAASAIVVGSLASTIAAAGAAVVTYASIMAAARVVFSGLSDEARGYAEAGTSVVAMLASGAVATRVSTAAYQLAAASMFRTAGASEFLRQSVDRLLSSAGALSGPALQAVSIYTTLTSIFGVASTAMDGFSNSQQSVARTFSDIAASVARFAATTAAIGAVSGAISALRTYAVASAGAMTTAGASTAVLSGAMRGATAAAGGLLSAFPAVAAAVSLAAVASGRFEKQLESLGAKAESIEQMADRFGASNEGVEKLRVAAANANVSMMALVRSQQNFYTNLSKVKGGQFDSQGVREAKLAFDELGIPVEKLKSLKPEESFRLVAKSLSEVKNAADKTRIAVDLFGARGAFALPALKEIGELEEDFDRLGGSIRGVDFKNILSLEASFDRVKNASESLGRTLLVPLVSLQRAFNNFSAELKGGLTAALAPLSTMLNSIAEPIAVIIEAVGRMINVTLRLIGVFTAIAAAFQVFASVAKLFEGIGEGFRAALAPLEALVTMFTSAGNEAGIFSGVITALETVLSAIGAAIGFVAGIVANAVIAVVAGAAAWGIYTAAMALASATSITAAISFATAWAAALGPFLPLLAGFAAAVAAIGGVVMAVAAGVKLVAGLFVSLGRSIGLVGKEREQIDASTASTRELATAAREAQDAASWFSDGESESALSESVDKARGSFNNLVTESLKFGKAGSDTITSVQKRYADLEQSLADGKISTEEFTKKTEDLFASASKGMKDYEQSAAVTLAKNLELYKQLDDSVRQAGKSIRDLTAGTVVEGEFFPASDEVKRRAAEFKAEYEAAIEAIKKKQQSGGFQVELDQRRQQLDDDLSAGRIDESQYASMKMELDSTNAQEQAKFAAEDVQREFDRKTAQLKADISFADDIRKKLDEAFLSPVEKFQKELKKVRDNPTLSGAEKDSAEKMLRRDARESLIGKSAQQTLSERTRDLNQASAAGLLGGPVAEAGGVPSELAAELRAAADEFASAVGVTKTPFEDFTSRLDNVTKQFGFAGQPLEAVREQLQGNAEQLALFDRAVQDARDSLLQSLGVEKSPQEVFEEQMRKISEAASAADPSMRISASQAAEARTAATRKRDSSFGINDDMAGQIADRRKDIEQAYGGGQDPAKFAAAIEKASDDLAAAVGVTKTPFEEFSSRLSNIAGQFGMAGQPLEEVRRKLAGNAEQLALFDRAVKEARDSLLQSLGVEKSPQQVFEEQMKKIDEAVNATDPSKMISESEAAQAREAATRKRDSALGAGDDASGQFRDRQRKIDEAYGGGRDPARLAVAQNRLDMDRRQAAGLDATPAQALRAGIDKINDAFGEAGKGTAEYNEAIKKNRDSVLQSVGIEKSAVQVRQEANRRLQGLSLSAGEAAQAQRKISDSFMSALGITKTPFEQFSGELDNIAEQFDMAGQPLEKVRESLKGNAKDLELFDRAVKQARDNLLASLGIEKTPQQVYEEQIKRIDEAANATDPNERITAEEATKARLAASRKREEALGADTANTRAGRFDERRREIEEAFGKNGEKNQEAFNSAMENLKKQGPGAEQENPVRAFQDSLKELEYMKGSGAINDAEFADRKLNLQAQLQEDLKPMLDKVAPDRRGVEGSDVRSKAGTDTFFRLLRGNDNPSLKAQLDIARNTRVLADAAREPEAAPVIAQLGAR